MNKLIIVLLAVCLVTVSAAIVKRDAETATPNYMDDVQKQLQDIANTVKDKFSEALDPEKIKKSFTEGVDTVQQFINNMQNKGSEAKQ